VKYGGSSGHGWQGHELGCPVRRLIDNFTIGGTRDGVPRNSWAHFELARLYVNQQEFENGAEEELRALELDNKLELADQLKSSGKEHGAETAYREVELRLLYLQLHDLQTRMIAVSTFLLQITPGPTRVFVTPAIHCYG